MEESVRLKLTTYHELKIKADGHDEAIKHFEDKTREAVSDVVSIILNLIKSGTYGDDVHAAADKAGICIRYEEEYGRFIVIGKNQNNKIYNVKK